MKQYHFTRGDSIWRIESIIDEVFSIARIQKMRHDELNERTSAIVSALNRKYTNGKRAIPAFVAYYASGYVAARRNDIWRNEVEFCYLDNNGVLFSTHRDSLHRKTEEFYSTGRSCELADMQGRHYWKGTDKPFGGSVK